MINEEPIQEKLPARFSKKILQSIRLVVAYNKNNRESLKQWLEYIRIAKDYVANPTIAWDYTNRYAYLPNKTKFIHDFEFNIGYTIFKDYSTNQDTVFIFMMNLKLNEYGLSNPFPKTANKPNKVVIKESDLCRIIRKSIYHVLRG